MGGNFQSSRSVICNRLEVGTRFSVTPSDGVPLVCSPSAVYPNFNEKPSAIYQSSACNNHHATVPFNWFALQQSRSSTSGAGLPATTGEVFLYKVNQVVCPALVHRVGFTKQAEEPSNQPWREHECFTPEYEKESKDMIQHSPKPVSQTCYHSYRSSLSTLLGSEIISIIDFSMAKSFKST